MTHTMGPTTEMTYPHLCTELRALSALSGTITKKFYIKFLDILYKLNNIFF